MHQLGNESGDKLQIVALDVTDLESIKKVAAELGGEAIDLLLNNAGVGGPRGQTIGKIDYDAWAEVLDVNTLGPLRGQKWTFSPRTLILHFRQQQKEGVGRSRRLFVAWDSRC